MGVIWPWQNEETVKILLVYSFARRGKCYGFVFFPKNLIEHFEIIVITYIYEMGLRPEIIVG